MGSSQFRCHRCGSFEGYRSRSRSLLEKYFLPLLLLHPVRCGHCYRRSYLPVFVKVPPAHEKTTAKHDAA